MNEIMQTLLELQTLDFGETQNSKTAALIAALREKVPAQVLGHYDRLRVRGKKGLAVVRNKVCTGCHMGLTLGTFMTLRHGLDLQLCDGCGRYLYLPEEPTAPVEPPAPLKPVKITRKRKPKTPAAETSGA